MCGGGGSLVMLPVQRPSLCTSLTGVKYVCERVPCCVCSGWPSLYSSLSVVKCVCMSVGVVGWGGV